MGHYWREMCPDQADEHDRRMDISRQCRELQKRLKDAKASAFTVRELEDILVDVEFGHDNGELLARLKKMGKRLKLCE